MVSIVAVLALSGASAAGAAAQASPSPPVGSARLEGSFLLAGHVTLARHIRGEHTGENVTRRWQFTGLCPSGPCQTVVLVRHRHAATDTVTLLRRSPGNYSGQGSFTAPLSCDGTTYPRGERVPFTIAVRIDAATVQGGTVMASRISATYSNPVRINRTPCVAALGHDAARYHGHLVPPPGT
jgi:hypothetical protein